MPKLWRDALENFITSSVRRIAIARWRQWAESTKMSQSSIPHNIVCGTVFFHPMNALKLIETLFRIFCLTFQSIFLSLCHVLLFIFYHVSASSPLYLLGSFLLTSCISEPYVRWLELKEMAKCAFFLRTFSSLNVLSDVQF